MVKSNKREDNNSDIKSKLVQVNRITKVVKGGRRMRFSALVVCGDGKGKVGIGTGKAAEVPEAIKKAEQVARKHMVNILLDKNTIPHVIIGKFRRSIVLLFPAPEGTGVIAGSSVRAVAELVGIKNITTKSLGSRNPINCVKATMNGLLSLKNAELVAKLRGKNINEIIS